MPKKVILDRSELLGFRIEQQSIVGAKTGRKIGAKIGRKIGRKIGVKAAR